MNKLAFSLWMGLTATALQADPHLYLALGGGFVHPGHEASTEAASYAVLYSPTAVPSTHSQFSLPSVNWRNQFNNGYEFNIALGGQFSERMRVEGEFLYQNFDRLAGGHYSWQEVDATNGVLYAYNNSNEIEEAKRAAHLYAPMMNAYFDFKNKTRWTPFAGVGIGLGILHSNGTESNNTLTVHYQTGQPTVNAPAQYHSPTLHGGAFAWQAKAGVNYHIQDSVTIDVTYRLLGTTTFLTSESDITTNADDPANAVFDVPGGSIRGLLNNSVNASLRFMY